MSRPIKLVIDCSTGIQTEVELTDEEIAENEAAAIIAEQRRAVEKAEEEARAAAKASAEAKLSALGLTPEEIAALR